MTAGRRARCPGPLQELAEKGRWLAGATVLGQLCLHRRLMSLSSLARGLTRKHPRPVLRCGQLHLPRSDSRLTTDHEKLGHRSRLQRVPCREHLSAIAVHPL